MRWWWWCSCLATDGTLEEKLESLEVWTVNLNSGGQVSCLTVQMPQWPPRYGVTGGMERGGKWEGAWRRYHN